MDEFDLELVFAYTGMVLIITSSLVWAVFIRDFIRGQGGRPAFALFNWSPLFDYRKARAITKKIGYVPWFVRVFEIMLGTAVLIIIALAVHIAVRFG